MKKIDRKMNPCVDYCFFRYGRQYSLECDNTCEFAIATNALREINDELNPTTVIKPRTEKEYRETLGLTEVYKLLEAYEATGLTPNDITYAQYLSKAAVQP